MYLFANILLILFVCLSSFFKLRKNQIVIFTIVLFVFFIVHDGLRWETGTDWVNYYKYFNDCKFINSDEIYHYDIGYQYLNKYIRILSDNYTIFLLIHAIIIYSLFFNSISKYSTNKFISFFLLYSLMLPYLGMNRQYITLAISIFTLRYIVNEEYLKAFIIISIAFIFHSSIILFIPVLFLNFKISTKIIIYGLIISILISISGLLNSIPQSLFYIFGETIKNKAINYISNPEASANVKIIFTTLGIIKRLFWLLIILKYRKILEQKTPYFNLMFNMYFIGTFFYLIFNNSIFQIIIERGLIYYNISEIFLIPLLLLLSRNTTTKIIIIMMIVFYCIITQVKGLNGYQITGYDDIFRPYKGIFINSDIHRIMH